MSLSIRYFGQLTEIAGLNAQKISFIPMETIGGLMDRIKKMHPEFHGIATTCALNGSLSQYDQVLSANDHIDLFPPFSGG